MNHSIKVGFSFGLASGVITTLGLIVGLHSSTHSLSVIIGGILIIAIADALSDATGIHISEESENKHTTLEIWQAATATFFTKFIFALTFVVPLLLFQLTTAIIVSIAWGLSLLTIFSIYLAKQQKAKIWKVVGEHLFIAVAVIVITHYVGRWVSLYFG
ncbi:hypothetical protein GOV03_04680 [Candidatus Woesearchaeota archaeon]|nr:hypothetical protein [Candidatus Woesearchaeota archaeon]